MRVYASFRDECDGFSYDGMLSCRRLLRLSLYVLVATIENNLYSYKSKTTSGGEKRFASIDRLHFPSPRHFLSGKAPTPPLPTTHFSQFLSKVCMRREFSLLGSLILIFDRPSLLLSVQLCSCLHLTALSYLINTAHTENNNDSYFIYLKRSDFSVGLPSPSQPLL